MVALRLLGGARNPVMSVGDAGALTGLPVLRASRRARGRSGSRQPRWRCADGSGGGGLVVAARFVLGIAGCSPGTWLAAGRWGPRRRADAAAAAQVTASGANRAVPTPMDHARAVRQPWS